MIALLSALLVVAPAAAIPEVDAQATWLMQNSRPGVITAGHEPPTIPPGTQWSGYITLADNVTFKTVRFQICRVGQVCFAPPTLARQIDERTWGFNTTDYRAPGSGDLIRWEAGWHLGVRYVIEDQLDNGTLRTTVFPTSDDLTTAGAESHYLTLDIAGQPEKPAPGVQLALLLVALTVAATIRRR